MSKNYAKVKRYYDSRLWSAAMVHTAVGKWITAEDVARHAKSEKCKNPK